MSRHHHHGELILIFWTKREKILVRNTKTYCQWVLEPDCDITSDGGSPKINSWWEHECERKNVDKQRISLWKRSVWWSRRRKVTGSLKHFSSSEHECAQQMSMRLVRSIWTSTKAQKNQTVVVNLDVWEKEIRARMVSRNGRIRLNVFASFLQPLLNTCNINTAVHYDCKSD